MRRKQQRKAAALVDLTVALSILISVAVIAGQTALWSLSERIRGEQRQEALEAAANVLEAARAQPLTDLNASWAAQQKLSDSQLGRLAKGKLTIAVEPEKDRPSCKRVSAEVTWAMPDGKLSKPVRLTAVFGPRTGAAKGGQP